MMVDGILCHERLNHENHETVGKPLGDSIGKPE